MRFLVIGAGNIGSLYAAKLAQSGQEVTVLARGARLEQIRRHG
ncbi:MAG: NAD-binding protein, partial [Myxococcales bacterium]|nr:NAD-binding protein [Myxococcales bacterium]